MIELKRAEVRAALRQAGCALPWDKLRVDQRKRLAVRILAERMDPQSLALADRLRRGDPHLWEFAIVE